MGWHSCALCASLHASHLGRWSVAFGIGDELLRLAWPGVIDPPETSRSDVDVDETPVGIEPNAAEATLDSVVPHFLERNSRDRDVGRHAAQVIGVGMIIRGDGSISGGDPYGVAKSSRNTNQSLCESRVDGLSSTGMSTSEEIAQEIELGRSELTSWTQPKEDDLLTIMGRRDLDGRNFSLGDGGETSEQERDTAHRED